MHSSPSVLREKPDTTQPLGSGNAAGSYPDPGLQIGLALVRKVVERIGGRLGVESQEGQGSQFWTELRPAAGPKNIASA